MLGELASSIRISSLRGVQFCQIFKTTVLVAMLARPIGTFARVVNKHQNSIIVCVVHIS